jgi:hypothetical protein
MYVLKNYDICQDKSKLKILLFFKIIYLEFAYLYLYVCVVSSVMDLCSLFKNKVKMKILINIWKREVLLFFQFEPPKSSCQT